LNRLGKHDSLGGGEYVVGELERAGAERCGFYSCGEDRKGGQLEILGNFGEKKQNTPCEERVQTQMGDAGKSRRQRVSLKKKGQGGLQGLPWVWKIMGG